MGLQPLKDDAMTGPQTIDNLLLQDLDRTPYMAGAFPRDWMQSEAVDRARERISRLLSAWQAPAQLGVHPQTLPLWLECLADRQLLPRILHILRHPHEVALSLREKRQLKEPVPYAHPEDGFSQYRPKASLAEHSGISHGIQWACEAR